MKFALHGKPARTSGRIQAAVDHYGDTDEAGEGSLAFLKDIEVHFVAATNPIEVASDAVQFSLFLNISTDGSCNSAGFSCAGTETAINKLKDRCDVIHSRDLRLPKNMKVVRA